MFLNSNLKLITNPFLPSFVESKERYDLAGGCALVFLLILSGVGFLMAIILFILWRRERKRNSCPEKQPSGSSPMNGDTTRPSYTRQMSASSNTGLLVNTAAQSPSTSDDGEISPYGMYQC